MQEILPDNINARNAQELAVAVQNDEEFNNLLSCVTIAQGGML